ncbi:ABC transporter permease [Gemmatimonadota bacterium]
MRRADRRASGFGTRSRHTFRRLARDWRYSLGIMVILAMGIGPATVGLSVRENVLLRPLGHREPDRLGVVRIDFGELQNHPGLDQDELLDLRDVEGAFQAVEWAIFDRGYLGVGEETVSVAVASTSPGLLHTLGVIPSLGRFFPEDDPRADGVILSHALWQSHFGGDPDVIGRTVPVWGRPEEIIGVLPPDFNFTLGAGSYAPSRIDIWTVVPAVRSNPGTGGYWGWNALVRLEDRVSFAQANQVLEVFARDQVERYPHIYAGSPLRYTVSPLLADLVREIRPAIRAALTGVLLLLLTAVVNAAALLVLASKKRERELAIRSAIGAGRGTLIADGLREGLILGVAGIALGWLLANWGIMGVRTFIPHAVPRWETITFGWEPAAVVAGVTLLGLLLAGALSAWKGGAATPWKGLAGTVGEERGGGGRGQSILVGGQVAMAVVLLFGAVQLARSARSLAATDLGFRPENVMAFQVVLTWRGFTAADRPWENQRYQVVRDRMREVPGVRSVGAISSVPLTGRGTVNTFASGEADTAATREDRVASYYAVLPGYFESVGTPLLRGRDFTDAENVQEEAVAIVDETLAALVFPGEDPIGKTIRIDVPGGSRRPHLPDPRIVGVVRHARVIDPTRELRPQIYLPYGFWRWAPLYMTVRAEGDPTSLTPEFREIVRELGRGHPVSSVQLLTDNLATETATLRSVTILVVVVALSASVLCAFGLFAVASYVVVRQRRAIAIRGALGASPTELLREQIRGRSTVLAVAVPIGVLLSLAGARVLESLVYGVEVWDPMSLAAAAVLGVVMGLLGTYLPARRAAKTDPVTSLQLE